MEIWLVIKIVIVLFVVFFVLRTSYAIFETSRGRGKKYKRDYSQDE